MFYFGCLSAGALRRTKRSIFISGWRVIDACYIERTNKEKNRLDHDDHRTVLQPVSCPSTARVARQQLLYFSLFPANDIYTYHFVYRYSMTIFLKFSVQKLFTFALVVIQITCISARVSGD